MNQQKLLTLDDLPKGWSTENTRTAQWVFIDNSDRVRIAVARHLRDEYPHEGWVEFYSVSKENWVIVLDRNQEVTHSEAMHWALTMILLGEAERTWNV